LTEQTEQTELMVLRVRKALLDLPALQVLRGLLELREPPERLALRGRQALSGTQAQAYPQVVQEPTETTISGQTETTMVRRLRDRGVL